MNATDILNHDLKKGLGYNKKETDAFLQKISESFFALSNENQDLKEKLKVLNDGLQYYKSIEKTLQKALVLAQKTADDNHAESLKKARELELDAEIKAEAVVKEANEKAEATLNEANEEALATLNEANEKAETAVREANEKAETTLREANEKALEIVTEAKNDLALTLSKASELSIKMKDYKEVVKGILNSQLSLLENPSFESLKEAEEEIAALKKLREESEALSIMEERQEGMEAEETTKSSEADWTVQSDVEEVLVDEPTLYPPSENQETEGNNNEENSSDRV